MSPSHPKIPTLISWLIASFALASQSSLELDGDEAKDETPSYRRFNLHKFAAPSLATAAFAASGAICNR